MNLEETKVRLGNFVNEISIAQSYISRSEALDKMCDYISDKGFDVDEQYLNFIQNVDRNTIDVKIKYVPIYRVTSLVRLYWKDFQENQDKNNLEHQEFVRFTIVFDASENNKRNRINNLNLVKIIDKKATKLNEERYTSLDQYQSNDVKMLATKQVFTPSIVMDVPLNDGEIYPLEMSYIIRKEEIDRRVNLALKQTKSYKRVHNEKEKWSTIEKIDVEVVLVPIAIVKIGLHEQYVNCANGEMDVQYEQNRGITKNLLLARWMAFPTIGIFLILCIISFILKWNLEYRFEGLPVHFLGNYADFIWVVLFILGILFSLIAIPSRKGIVKRATSNKDRLRISRIFTRFLIDVCIGLLILTLMSI